MLCSLVTYIVGLVAVRFSALGAFNTIFSRRFSHWSEGLLVDALFVQVHLIGHSPSLIQQISSDADVAIHSALKVSTRTGFSVAFMNFLKSFLSSLPAPPAARMSEKVKAYQYKIQYECDQCGKLM